MDLLVMSWAIRQSALSDLYIQGRYCQAVTNCKLGFFLSKRIGELLITWKILLWKCMLVEWDFCLLWFLLYIYCQFLVLPGEHLILCRVCKTALSSTVFVSTSWLSCLSLLSLASVLELFLTQKAFSHLQILECSVTMSLIWPAWG